MKLTAWIAVMLLLAACGQPPPPSSAQTGDEFLNGGDELPKRFEAGRAKAVRIVEAVERLQEDDFPLREAGWEALASFYAERRAALVSDLRATPSYRWVKRNRNGACGQTTTAPTAPVSLSYDDCRSVLTETDAAALLLGESLHHLGLSSDAETARLCIAVRSAWRRYLGGLGSSQWQRNWFEEGRWRVAQGLSRVRDDAFSGYRFLLLPEEHAWLVHYRQVLAQHIAMLAIEWTDELPAGPGLSSCAVYDRKSGKLTLSYSGCAIFTGPYEPARILLETFLWETHPRLASAILAIISVDRN